MTLAELLDDPYFDDHHRALVPRLKDWVRDDFPDLGTLGDARACQALVAALGHAGWLRYAVAGSAYGGGTDKQDVRSLCLIRESLAGVCALADFAFVMQGLGSAAISLAGTDAQKARYLPAIAQGEAIAAFALSEAGAGSDAAALQCRAERRGEHYLLNGEKCWISNAPIAHTLTVFARTGERGARGISAFIVAAHTPGCTVSAPTELLAAHPMASVSFKDCVLPAAQRLGEEGEGFALAMRVLDIFRPSVAAAALGFAQRALDVALEHSQKRALFGQHLSDLQMTRAKLAQMVIELSAARLLTYRAAWQGDAGQRITAAAAMAKYSATEAAQRIVDAALQLCGAAGLVKGHALEALYREVRALRIYEGASEVQLLIVARELLAAAGQAA